MIECENYLNSNNFNCSVFSFGGCGTNFLRRVLNLYGKILPNLLIQKTVHMYLPPNIDNSDFLAIYLFGDPYLSFYSIFRRKIFNTINILAGKQIFKSKKDVNYKKILNMNMDVLRFKNQFLNWYNSKKNYPILFINYTKLNKDILNDICQIIKSEFNINYNLDKVNNFRERVSSIDKFDIEDLNSLEKIYGNFKNYINNLPTYWIKYPKTHLVLKEGNEKEIGGFIFRVDKTDDDHIFLAPVDSMRLPNMILEFEYYSKANKEDGKDDLHCVNDDYEMEKNIKKKNETLAEDIKDVEMDQVD